MNKKYLFKAAFDGFFHGFIVDILGEYIVSVYSQDQSLYLHLFISGFCVIISAVSYFLYIFKESNNKKIIVFSLCSILCFILSVAVIFINCFTLRISIFPVREVWYGDGLSLMFTLGGFVLFSAVLRLVILGIFIIKNIHNLKYKCKITVNDNYDTHT